MHEMPASPRQTEERFLALLNRAYDGWLLKIQNDFSQASYEAEIANLGSDDVYRSFGLACPEYALIRLMGRMSISIGRRLGELYDNLPRYVAAARFGLEPREVATKINSLQLDVCVPFDRLSKEDLDVVNQSVVTHFGSTAPGVGLGIEIRYNFNPNDSARLRKDEAMADGLKQKGLFPIYLVYSTISPRIEAIARLKRAGWHFLVGPDAVAFTKSLLGLDLTELLGDVKVQGLIRQKVDKIMGSLGQSDAFRAAAASMSERPDPSD
ncbi:MAG TPA: hypothetical protein VFR48_04180 [Solirubrobacteraceae bacterium]|nr:hypothetical protein [Solirubrobacteraceae bacterium]